MSCSQLFEIFFLFFFSQFYRILITLSRVCSPSLARNYSSPWPARPQIRTLLGTVLFTVLHAAYAEAVVFRRLVFLVACCLLTISAKSFLLSSFIASLVHSRRTVPRQTKLVIFAAAFEIHVYNGLLLRKKFSSSLHY